MEDEVMQLGEYCGRSFGADDAYSVGGERLVFVELLVGEEPGEETACSR